MIMQVRAGRASSTETTAGESHSWHQAEEVWGRACTARDHYCQGLHLFYSVYLATITD